jgi:hypothetical protein
VSSACYEDHSSHRRVNSRINVTETSSLVVDMILGLLVTSAHTLQISSSSWELEPLNQNCNAKLNTFYPIFLSNAIVKLFGPSRTYFPSASSSLNAMQSIPESNVFVVLP